MRLHSRGRTSMRRRCRSLSETLRVLVETVSQARKLTVGLWSSLRFWRPYLVDICSNISRCLLFTVFLHARTDLRWGHKPRRNREIRQHVR